MLSVLDLIVLLLRLQCVVLDAGCVSTGNMTHDLSQWRAGPGDEDADEAVGRGAALDAEGVGTRHQQGIRVPKALPALPQTDWRLDVGHGVGNHHICRGHTGSQAAGEDQQHHERQGVGHGGLYVSAVSRKRRLLARWCPVLL